MKTTKQGSPPRFENKKPPCEAHIQLSNRRIINIKSQEGAAKVRIILKIQKPDTNFRQIGRI